MWQNEIISGMMRVVLKTTSVPVNNFYLIMKKDSCKASQFNL